MNRLFALTATLGVLAIGALVYADNKNKAGAKVEPAPKEYIRWVVDFEAAKKEAQERNVPIVFCWHKDH